MQVRYSGHSCYVTSRSDAQIVRVCSNKKKQKQNHSQMYVHGFHNQTPANVIAIERPRPPFLACFSSCNLPFSFSFYSPFPFF